MILPLLLQRGNRHLKQMAFTFFLLASIVHRLDIESNKRLGLSKIEHCDTAFEYVKKRKC